MACFSTQICKHMNSDVGGLLTTDDADLAAHATILRPQLVGLTGMIEGWNNRFREVENELRGQSLIALIQRPPQEHPVGSSMQCRLPIFSPDQCHADLDAVQEVAP